MSLHEELEKRQVFNHIVNVTHVSDGFVITRVMANVPRKGEWIVLGEDTYVVKLVIWNFSDARTVTVMVEDPEE
jgi:hypothetical protein